MEIKKELLLENVVILANNFNPSIFSSHWLIKNEFCKEEDILPSSIFGPQVAQIATKNWQMLVASNQLQFVKANDFTGSFGELIQNVLAKIIYKLSEIPYHAIGINFHFLVSSSDPLSGYTRELFFKGESKLFKAFDKADAEFGSYMSYDYKGSRLRLNITPVKVEGRQGTQLQFVFNYHKDVMPDDRTKQVLERLSNWQEFQSETTKIINLL